MKPQNSTKFINKIDSLDGPPLDFSFKGIRTL